MKSRPTVTCSACGEKRLHRGHGWCDTCYGRWVYHGKPASGPPPRRTPARCGTRQGWDRHRYLKEKACDPCRTAHADSVREWSHTSPRLMHRTEPVVEWDDKQARAARKVAGMAAGPDDCRQLLAALGLLPQPEKEAAA
ncbi:MAG TPA: hypothetical protein VFH77_02155 [Streptomyces sp.]|nr:hypothetical protein [Streptomyces sp.]